MGRFVYSFFALVVTLAISTSLRASPSIVTDYVKTLGRPKLANQDRVLEFEAYQIDSASSYVEFRRFGWSEAQLAQALGEFARQGAGAKPVAAGRGRCFYRAEGPAQRKQKHLWMCAKNGALYTMNLQSDDPKVLSQHLARIQTGLKR